MARDMRISATLLGIICCLLKYVICQTGTDAKNLRTQLFTTEQYDYRVRPQDDQTVPIDVYMNFYLLNINELDAVTETLKTTGYLWITWDDDFLVWDPVDYGGLSEQQWPQNDVWKPDVTLKNTFTDYKELGAASLRVNVLSDGQVTWYPFQVFQSTCSLDITYYPFDTQECSLTFGAWSYTSTEVNMQSGSKGVILEQYEKSSTWDLVSVDWRVQNDDSGDAEISFVIKIKRKPLNAIITLILPVIMLSILNLFVFMLPCSSGEKAGYAVTVFLAFAVFLTIIASSLPDNSQSVAYFSIYLVIQVTQSTLITLSALVLIRVSSFDNEREIPRILQFLTRLLSCKLCQERPKRTEVESLQENEKSANHLKKIRAINVKKGHEKDPIDDVQKHDPKNLTWEHVVTALDVLLFIIFATVLVVSTIVCFTIAATN